MIKVPYKQMLKQLVKYDCLGLKVKWLSLKWHKRNLITKFSLT